MKVKTIGMIISVLIITYMITVTIKNSLVEEEYPSGLIEDQFNELASKSSDLELGIKKNNVAPDFELQSLSGEVLKLSDYRGKKVFLNFWASWCGPCKVEMPYMEGYYKKYKDMENVEILAVNMTSSERNMEKMEEFVDSNELTFPVLIDNKGDVEKLYKVLSYPTTYLINEEGIVFDGFTGSLRNEEEIKELIDKIK